MATADNSLWGHARRKTVFKHYIVRMVYGYEDSMYEILSISLTTLYRQKKKQELHVRLRENNMYGTIFNYTGFGLQALNGKTPDACVPEYVFDLYHNPDETNPRKRLAKLTKEQVLNELNMNAIDEGCSIEQIAGFCDIHKSRITCLTLNTSCLKPTTIKDTEATYHVWCLCVPTTICTPLTTMKNEKPYSNLVPLSAVGLKR